MEQTGKDENLISLWIFSHLVTVLIEICLKINAYLNFPPSQDPNYLATVAMDACEVIILDVRVPCTPVARLNNHRACVNGIAWAPHSSCHICTAGE